jgi:hypothetical protein
MGRDNVEFHNGSGIEDSDGFDAWKLRQKRTLASVNENEVCRDRFCATTVRQLDVKGMSVGEAPFAHNALDACGFEFALTPAAKALDDIPFALSHAFHVNGDGWFISDCSTIDVYTIFWTATSEVGDAPTGDHGFSRSLYYIVFIREKIG